MPQEVSRMYRVGNPIYAAIIGDIIGSRSLSNRKEVQHELCDCLTRVNEKYADRVVSAFTITQGDEFQGLVAISTEVMKIVEYIEMTMHPVRIRFGVGIGSIETEIDPVFPQHSDGTAFHSARAMIEMMRNNESKNKTRYSNVLVLLEKSLTKSLESSTSLSEPSKDEIERKEMLYAINELINSTLSLCSVIKGKWTTGQREAAVLSHSLGDNQERIADALGITQPSVQSRLAGADYYTYREAMNSVSDAIQKSL